MHNKNFDDFLTHFLFLFLNNPPDYLINLHSLKTASSVGKKTRATFFFFYFPHGVAKSQTHLSDFYLRCVTLQILSLYGLPWWFNSVKNLPAMQEMQVQSLAGEDPLEEKMAMHSSIIAWKAPWAEEPGGL